MSENKVTRSFNRDELDESDRTALCCEQCGAWATEYRWFDLGPEEGTAYLCVPCVDATPSWRTGRK